MVGGRQGALREAFPGEASTCLGFLLGSGPVPLGGRPGSGTACSRYSWLLPWRVWGTHPLHLGPACYMIHQELGLPFAQHNCLDVVGSLDLRKCLPHL